MRKVNSIANSVCTLKANSLALRHNIAILWCNTWARAHLHTVYMTSDAELTWYQVREEKHRLVNVLLNYIARAVLRVSATYYGYSLYAFQRKKIHYFIRRIK